MGMPYIIPWAGITQLVWLLATGWTFRGSSPGCGRDFLHPSRPTQPPECWVLIPNHECKVAGAWLHHPPPPSTELKEGVDLYLTFTSRYLLTPWSRVLLEKLVKKFPALYGTRKFITVFTSARHLSLSWANSIQSPPPPTSRRSILILSSHLRLGLPNGLFPSGFPTPLPHVTVFYSFFLLCRTISWSSSDIALGNSNIYQYHSWLSPLTLRNLYGWNCIVRLLIIKQLLW